MSVKEIKILEGAVLKIAMLMTHYRQPLNYSEQRMKEAKQALDGWLKACDFTNEGPPVEFFECFTDDCNTVKVLALMHQLRKQKQGKKLFACMRWLGLFQGEVHFIDEIKTLPEDLDTNPFMNAPIYSA